MTEMKCYPKLPQEGIVSVKELAKLMGIHSTQMMLMLKRRGIKTVKLGQRSGFIYVDLAEFQPTL